MAASPARFRPFPNLIPLVQTILQEPLNYFHFHSVARSGPFRLARRKDRDLWFAGPCAQHDAVGD